MGSSGQVSSAGPVPTDAKRLLLPWRRWARNASRFDFTPMGGVRRLVHQELGWLILIPCLPLARPALVVLLVALLEVLCGLVVLPPALLWRWARHQWPVVLVDMYGGLVDRAYAPSWRAAGELARDWRSRIDKGTPEYLARFKTDY